MKIVWLSQSPTVPTGLGTVTRHVCPGLAARGHHVSILEWSPKPREAQPTCWQNCMLYPIRSLAAEQLLNDLRQLQPDILITLAEAAWVKYVANLAIADFMQTAGIPWVLYYPLDSDMGKNRLPRRLVDLLKPADLPVAMSRYSRDVTLANGVEPAYIPHGVDTKVFQPPTDKDVAKRSFGYKGKFVMLSDARNQPRKMLPRTLEIFRRFAANKNDVILHLHCDPDDPAARTPDYYYDLQSDIAFLNLTEKVSLNRDINMSIPRGIPLEQLAEIYQAADVHLLASWGEGFGLPTLQAAAAGVVPFASDYSASRELVLGHGEAIRVCHFLVDQFGLRRALIDIEDAVNKLERLYQDRQLLASKAQNSREFALSYDWECLVLQWEELLLHEIARKRMNSFSSANASIIPDTPHTEEGSFDLASRESTTGELETEEAIQPERTLTIPVTLPLIKSKQRIPGYVYAASQCDVPSVLALRRIFPGLKVWSTISLDFGSLGSDDKPLQVKLVEAHGPEYRPHLALSTLALDMSRSDPRLPIEAAKLGVPCIGLVQQREQARLWPDLSLTKPDPLMAAELGRQMLTDQGVATDLCLAARQRLAGALIANHDGLSVGYSLH
jgi:glycosyltransferase involved in cell wall biosynthesis